MSKYLYPEQFYVDQYDLHTIEECLSYYWGIKNKASRQRNNFKKMSNEEFDKELHKATSMIVNVISGERYRNKEITIQKWMEQDKKTQFHYDEAIPLEGIRCLNCNSHMSVAFKELHNSYEKNPRVLFIYKCDKCNNRRGIFEDGAHWEYEKELCPKCNSILNSSVKDKNNVMTTIYSCINCSYKKKDIYDFNKARQERLKKIEEDTKLLTEYRHIFCWNDKDGQQYIQTTALMSRIAEEEKKREQNKELYEKANKLKKLTVIQVEKLLNSIVIPEDYMRLELANSEISKHIIVRFTVQDCNENRGEYDSKNVLEKCIKNCLQNTNWRLMSDGIEYNLGYLSGRIKGYKKEEDLFTLVKNDH